jgi:acyl dehydratase
MTGLLDTLRSDIGVTRTSDWVRVDQSMINTFATTTMDEQFIHVDLERAAATPFGGTIAHGFLSLSLLSHLQETINDASMPAVTMAINYGFDRVRFVSPVRSGSRIRLSSKRTEIAEVAPNHFQQTHEIAVEIENQSRPAIVATWLTRFAV